MWRVINLNSFKGKSYRSNILYQGALSTQWHLNENFIEVIYYVKPKNSIKAA